MAVAERSLRNLAGILSRATLEYRFPGDLDSHAWIALTMSSKQSRKTSSATASSSASMRQEIARLIQKDRLKDAVKQAKMCFKEEDSEENHQLLERAYFLRARQLLKLGMPDSALEVAQHLLEFGITPCEWVDEFVRLLISVGLAEDAFRIQARSGSPEQKDRLAILAADQAVIHPERMQDVSTEIAREAGLIRESLEKLRSQDEAAAVLLLRDLPRSSPLSDWKLFVRGLAAHYRGDAVETRANWDRLDSNRQPYKIAQRLQRLGRGTEDATRRWRPRGPREGSLRRGGPRAADAIAEPGGGPGVEQGVPPLGPAPLHPAPHRPKTCRTADSHSLWRDPP